MEDRRRHQRYGCSSERNFIARYENKDTTVGEIKDFSRSGISFDSKEDLTKEKEIKLNLRINGLAQKVPASIQVIWSKDNPEGRTYGAKFTNIVAENKFDIMDLLYQDWRKNINTESLLS